MSASRTFRQSPRDGWLVAACGVWAVFGAVAVMTATPAVVLVWIALGVWWLSNTVAHVHLHTPLFRSARMNGALSTVLTAVTGIPQSLWRALHLWHHAGEPPLGPRPPARRVLAFEVAVVGLTWGAIAALDARTFLLGYVPGWLVGLALCALHGRGEHVGERHRALVGTSCRGRFYNRLWFNDGYHAEHHREPGRHWTALPDAPSTGAESAWPPAVRGIVDVAAVARGKVEAVASRRVGAGIGTGLGWLECATAHSPRLQAWLVRAHRDAFASVLAGAPLPPAPRVGIVGGGLFPRSYLALTELMPAAQFDLIDRDPHHLVAAERYLARRAGGATADAPVNSLPAYRTFEIEAGVPLDYDVVVVPLAFVGRRGRVYDGTMAPIVMVHDWLWRRRGDRSAVVSPWLVKRLNVVVRR